ncbi:hypothetical protein BvCms5BK_00933 [Escherichia coli]|nr:hypothetical protein T22_019466 [Escherichia coli O157:H43 str. T22]SQL06636.1 Uncharacterised protein [Escherichia coli]GCG06003.1 hypothetical protein BvCmsF52A_01498 [Escherichia coli]GCI13759.1 hypothetical protein BvCms5BK_00933 [Escherichia coli]GCJ60725.1 hypothetical protein BvCmsL71A_02183 [Escherichia coli]
MWKPTGDRVLTVLIDSKPQYSRIETNGKDVRLVRK